MSHDLVIVGGGVAGLSAAVRLAGAGARVLLLEARSRLGGRAASWPDKETGELVDNGQHVLLGAYRATLEFLGQIGADRHLEIQAELSVPMIDRSGRASRLTSRSFPPPFGLLAGLFDWDALSWADRFAALGMAGPLRRAQRELRPGATEIAASPGETVENWLVRNGQTPRIREMLWDPLALATLNQPSHDAAATVFARVLAEAFGPDPKSSRLILPGVPLDTLFAAPARAYVEARGGEVRTGAPATIRLDAGGVTAVTIGAERIETRCAIAAVPWFKLPTLFDGEVGSLRSVLDRARATAHVPIVTCNAWFDRPVLGERFVGLPGRAMQWAFERPSPAHAGSFHVSLVASGASELTGRTNEEIVDRALGELFDAVPGARRAVTLAASVVREPRATFSLAPGQPARPSATTGIEGLFLAGDWVDTGLPATIEGAVRSGHRAATLALGNLVIS